jgi:hypothetical protein
MHHRLGFLKCLSQLHFLIIAFIFLVDMQCEYIHLTLFREDIKSACALIYQII